MSEQETPKPKPEWADDVKESIADDSGETVWFDEKTKQWITIKPSSDSG